MIKTPATPDLIDVLFAGGDDITLPSLTREELIALGDEPVLADAEDELWWAGLSEDTRQVVLQVSRRGLVARALLRPVPGRDALETVDAVDVIMETRRHPSWLCVLREPVADNDTQVIVWGIEHDAGPDAAMLSARVDGIHLARLTSAENAVTEAVDWLTDPEPHTVVPGGGAGRPLLRAVEVLSPARPGVRDRMATRRALLAHAGSVWHLAEVAADGSRRPDQRVGPPDVASWLTGIVGHAGVGT